MSSNIHPRIMPLTVDSDRQISSPVSRPNLELKSLDSTRTPAQSGSYPGLGVLGLFGVDGFAFMRLMLQILAGPPNNIRMPETQLRGDLLRSTFLDANGQKTPVVPLTSSGLADPTHRVAGPTDVRVMFDKLEELKPAIVPKGQIAALGSPERVTLVPDDRFRATLWNGNSTGEPVAQGLRLSDGYGNALQPSQVFKPGAFLVKVPGGERVSVDKCYDSKTGAIIAPPLAKGETGGWRLSADVRSDFPRGRTIDVQALAVNESDVSRTEKKGVRGPTRFNAVPENDPRVAANGIHLHQQFQSYGNYQGSAAAKPNSTVTIAAPGSYGYEGKDFRGIDDPAYKQATYYVPIDVTMNAPSAKETPKTFSVRTEKGAATDSNAVSFHYFDPRDKTKTETVKIGQEVPFHEGWVLRTEFKGGSATGVGVDFSGQR